MNMFRTLRADEIDCRIGMMKEKFLTLLLYKDARCDMNILDETVGEMNWQRKHSRDNANCIVSIRNNKMDEWVEKEDTGTESNTEAEKGLASDSFKRACVNWGIGRELYTAPEIKLWASKGDYSVTSNRTYDKFEVAVIEYDSNRNISKLAIRNKTANKIVFRWSNGQNAQKQNTPPQTQNRQEKPTRQVPPEVAEAMKFKVPWLGGDVVSLGNLQNNVLARLINSDASTVTPRHKEYAKKILDYRKENNNA